MRQDLWRAIYAARSDVDKLVAAAVGAYPDHGPASARRPAPQLVRAPSSGAPRPSTAQDTARLWIDPAHPAAAAAAAQEASVEHETLQRLHHDVHVRIESLRALLSAEPGGEQAALALVLYFDEYIMGKLPDFLATSWPLLQTRLTGRKTGGADFFRLIDRLLEAEPQPGFVFEVYYFCLANGFQGQYADDLVALDGYRQRVRARIVAPLPERQPREPVAAASPAPIRAPWLYYVVAVAGVVVVAFLLTVWSNR